MKSSTFYKKIQKCKVPLPFISLQWKGNYSRREILYRNRSALIIHYLLERAGKKPASIAFVESLTDTSTYLPWEIEGMREERIHRVRKTLLG